MRSRLTIVAVLLALWPLVDVGSADDPVSLLRAYFDSADARVRADLVSRLNAHRDFRPSRVRGWLRQALSYPAVTSGVEMLRVDVGGGDVREVVLRVPPGYRADRAWPLIYALHPSGLPASEWISQIEGMLGSRINQYLVAAPNRYRQNYIAAKPPFTPEHPAILDAVGRRVHVASDQVYAFGYSMGAYGAWFVALYYADRLAGAVAVAGGFDVAVDDDGFWKSLVGNVAHVPVLNVWGSEDTLAVRGLDGVRSGTMAENNRRFERAVRGMGLPITNIEVEGAGHYGLAPPGEPLLAALSGRRRDDPRRVTHTFRHLHQASAYWLEALTWHGDRWDATMPPAEPSAGESRRHAIAAALEPLLGRLTGEIDGQKVRVTRRHAADIVVWFGEQTVDWNRPVVVEVDGAGVFEGRLTRDLGVCLARAEATRDFDSLRWAAVQVDAAGRAQVLTRDTVPPPAWRAPAER